MHNTAGQYLKKLNGNTFQKQFSLNQQPQQQYLNKAFTRHQDQLTLGGGVGTQGSAHHNQRKPTVSAHAQGNQNIIRNRERFEHFKGRLGAKSNPPSADTATTATSTNATVIRQQQQKKQQSAGVHCTTESQGNQNGGQVLQGGMGSMRTLFQNTADRYTSRLPPPGVAGPCPTLQDSLRMVTAGASLYSSQ